jgi:nucleoside-diphosphate-sugar epimerase
MNVLVSGAAEFIGAALSHALLDCDDRVVGLGNGKALYRPAPTDWRP